MRRGKRREERGLGITGSTGEGRRGEGRGFLRTPGEISAHAIAHTHTHTHTHTQSAAVLCLDAEWQT